MKKNPLTKGNIIEAGYTTLNHDKLPELDASDMHIAATPSRIAFMGHFMASENVGRYHWFEAQGFTLQNAGAGVLRCIHLVDDEYALLCLARANQTIALAGGVLELAPFTVVQPFLVEEAEDLSHESNQPASAPKASVAGMEVA
jgi:hypothetical protein